MIESLYDRVIFEINDRVARVTLAHSPGNALDMAMARGLREAAARVAQTGSLR